jgi:hypothetical protein
MMFKSLITAVKLIGAATSIYSAMIILPLPCFAQTVKYTTIVRPRVIRPISYQNSTNFTSRVGTTQSRNACFQVDANSRIYVRNISGGIRYYPNNNPSSYSQAIVGYSRCN